MTLSELMTEVYQITNRPDLVSQTSAAVRAATLKIHQSDYFYKDIREQGLVFSTLGYTQQIEYKVIFPLWRAFKYLRKTDVTGTDTLGFLELIPPELVLDQYNLNREDVCYVAGSVIQIRSSTQIQYAIHGYYENPNITVAGFSSWVADDHPFAIVYEAAAQIFKQTGDTEQFAAFTQLAREQVITLRNSNIQAAGY